MKDIIKRIEKTKIIPVVEIEDPKNAVRLGEALLKGGIKIAEITFRTEAAEESIKLLTKKLPELLVGAGTVLTKEQVKKAKKAGAKFLVAPGFNPKVVKYCQKKNILIIPGISNPSLIEQALEKNLNLLKFFPAGPLGGIPFLKAMTAPYKNIKFIPTGGINQHNLLEYLSADFVLACGGSWMVKKTLIRDKNFRKITELSKEAKNLIDNFLKK